MVLDPLFAHPEIVSKAREVHKSAAGADSETVDIEAATKDLVELTVKLQTPSNSPTNDPALDSICQGCKNVTQELLDALAKVKVECKNSKWKSTRKALRSVWSKDEISGIERRLTMFRDEINLRLVADVRERVDLLAIQQLCLSDLQRDNTQKIVEAMINDRHILQRALQSQCDDTKKALDQASAALAEEQAKTHVAVVNAVRVADNNQEEQKVILHQIFDVKKAMEQMREEIRKKDDEFKNNLLAYIHAHSPKKRKALRDKGNLISAALVALETVYRSLQVLLGSLQSRVKTLLGPLNTSPLWNAVPFPVPTLSSGPGTTQSSETARMLYYAYYYLSLVRGDLVRTDMHTLWPLQQEKYEELISPDAPNRLYNLEAAEWLRLKDSGPQNPATGMSWTWRVNGRLREISPGSLAYNFVWGMAVIAAALAECVGSKDAKKEEEEEGEEGEEKHEQLVAVFADLFDERYRVSEHKFTHASVASARLRKDVRVWQALAEMTGLRARVVEWLDEELSLFAKERKLTPRGRRRWVLDTEDEMRELVKVLILLTDRNPDSDGITLASAKVCAVANVIARCGINMPMCQDGLVPLVAHRNRYVDVSL